jgi:hypothetical protein
MLETKTDMFVVLFSASEGTDFSLDNKGLSILAFVYSMGQGSLGCYWVY